MQGSAIRNKAHQRAFVGIDVSKDWLDLWLAPLKRFERAGNDGPGWAAVIGLLKSLGIEAGIVVAFEATGRYDQGLQPPLPAAGFDVPSLLPPRRLLLSHNPSHHSQHDP